LQKLKTRFDDKKNTDEFYKIENDIRENIAKIVYSELSKADNAIGKSIKTAIKKYIK
jgi:hypothetical protein